MKKYLLNIIILVALAGFSIPVFAQTPSTVDDYKFLAPLPCKQGDQGCVLDPRTNTYKLESFSPAQRNSFGVYLNLMIKIVIGIAAVLSVVMIVVGGVEYMTSELGSSKEAGKGRITHAILGLLIALGAYALLYTINPDLLKSEMGIPATDSTALGTCKYPTVVGGVATKTNTTKSECDKLIIDGGGGFGGPNEGWIPYSTGRTVGP